MLIDVSLERSCVQWVSTDVDPQALAKVVKRFHCRADVASGGPVSSGLDSDREPSKTNLIGNLG